MSYARSAVGMRFGSEPSYSKKKKCPQKRVNNWFRALTCGELHAVEQSTGFGQRWIRGADCMSRSCWRCAPRIASRSVSALSAIPVPEGHLGWGITGTALHGYTVDEEGIDRFTKAARGFFSSLVGAGIVWGGVPRLEVVEKPHAGFSSIPCPYRRSSWSSSFRRKWDKVESAGELHPIAHEWVNACSRGLACHMCRGSGFLAAGHLHVHAVVYARPVWLGGRAPREELRDLTLQLLHCHPRDRADLQRRLAVVHRAIRENWATPGREGGGLWQLAREHGLGNIDAIPLRDTGAFTRYIAKAGAKYITKVSKSDNEAAAQRAAHYTSAFLGHRKAGTAFGEAYGLRAGRSDPFLAAEVVTGPRPDWGGDLISSADLALRRADARDSARRMRAPLMLWGQEGRTRRSAVDRRRRLARAKVQARLQLADADRTCQHKASGELVDPLCLPGLLPGRYHVLRDRVEPGGELRSPLRGWRPSPVRPWNLCRPIRQAVRRIPGRAGLLDMSKDCEVSAETGLDTRVTLCYVESTRRDQCQPLSSIDASFQATKSRMTSTPSLVISPCLMTTGTTSTRPPSNTATGEPRPRPCSSSLTTARAAAGSPSSRSPGASNDAQRLARPLRGHGDCRGAGESSMRPRGFRPPPGDADSGNLREKRVSRRSPDGDFQLSPAQLLPAHEGGGLRRGADVAGSCGDGAVFAADVVVLSAPDCLVGWGSLLDDREETPASLCPSMGQDRQSRPPPPGLSVLSIGGLIAKEQEHGSLSTPTGRTGPAGVCTYSPGPEGPGAKVLDWRTCDATATRHHNPHNRCQRQRVTITSREDVYTMDVEYSPLVYAYQCRKWRFKRVCENSTNRDSGGGTCTNRRRTLRCGTFSRRDRRALLRAARWSTFWRCPVLHPRELGQLPRITATDIHAEGPGWPAWLKAQTYVTPRPLPGGHSLALAPGLMQIESASKPNLLSCVETHVQGGDSGGGSSPPGGVSGGASAPPLASGAPWGPLLASGPKRSWCAVWAVPCDGFTICGVGRRAYRIRYGVPTLRGSPDSARDARLRAQLARDLWFCVRKCAQRVISKARSAILAGRRDALPRLRSQLAGALVDPLIRRVLGDIDVDDLWASWVLALRERPGRRARRSEVFRWSWDRGAELVATLHPAPLPE